MLRPILRNIQFTLLLSASLLVLLAFQRLQNDDLFSIRHQLYSSVPHLDRHDTLVGIGGRRRNALFSTNVIEIGFFRFVVPFRWVNSGSDIEGFTAGMTPLSARQTFEENARDKNVDIDIGSLKRLRTNVNSNSRRGETLAGMRESFPKKREMPLVRETSIAYAVLTHACPFHTLELTEGLAVLRQSISTAQNSSKYKKYKLYVIVGDAEGDSCGVSARSVALDLGFEVLTISPGDNTISVSNSHSTIPTYGDSASVVSSQIQHTDQFVIRENQLDGRANKSLSQNWPLAAQAFSNFDIVIFLRTDSIVLRPLDNLIDAMVYSEQSASQFNDLRVLIESDEKAIAFRHADAVVRKGDMGVGIVKTNWSSLFPFILDTLRAIDVEEGGFRSFTASNAESWVHLKRTHIGRQKKSTRTLANNMTTYDISTLLMLDSCRFGRRKRGIDDHCDVTVSLRDSWVASSRSCSPPWSCSMRDGGSDDVSNYCDELNRVWFRYRRQLDKSMDALATPRTRSMQGERFKQSSYNAFCKHGGLNGYIKYQLYPRIRNKVARF